MTAVELLYLIKIENTVKDVEIQTLHQVQKNAMMGMCLLMMDAQILVKLKIYMSVIIWLDNNQFVDLFVEMGL